jgi:hypothetical protein
MSGNQPADRKETTMTIQMTTKMSLADRTAQASRMLKSGYSIAIVAHHCALPYKAVVNLIG